MDREHLNQAEWTAYRERTLSAAAMLEVSDHLLTHPEQRGEQPPVSFATDPEDASFGEPYEEIAAWVDGTMTDATDREIFEARLRIDPRLAAAVADLAAFRAELARTPARLHGPVAPAASNIIPFRRPSPSHWMFPLAAAATVMLTMILWNALQPAGRPSYAEINLPPLAPELRTVRGTLAGAVETPSLQATAPAAPIVRERRPLFTWTSLKPADAFVVQLARTSDGELVSSPTLPATARSWQPLEPLTPGAIYEWQVQALRGDAPVDLAPKPPEPEARFQVLSDTAEHNLQSAEKDADRSELSVGMACAQAGLTKEADAHWRNAGLEGERLRAKLRDAEKRAGYLH